jgi:splicing factor 3B subunit 1
MVTRSQSKKQEKQDDRGIAFGTDVVFDDAYGAEGGGDEYVEALPTAEEERRMMEGDDVKAREDEEMMDEGRISSHPSTMAAAKRKQVRLLSVLFGMLESLPKNFSQNNNFLQAETGGEDEDPFANREGGSGLVNTRIADRESEYQKRRHARTLREDGTSFKDAMAQATIEKERHELIQEARKDLLDDEGNMKQAEEPPKRRRRRWDDAEANGKTEEKQDSTSVVTDSESVSSNKNRWDEPTTSSSPPRRRKRWDETPVVASASAVVATPKVAMPNATPVAGSAAKWGETPVVSAPSETPGRKRSRWDATPTPGSSSAAQPAALATPISGNLAKALALEREMESRNRPWTEAALDAILPSEGYTIIRPPASYVPIRTPARKLLATPTPMGMTPAGFQMEVPVEERKDASIQDIREAYGVPLAATAAEEGAGPGALPFIKPEDMQYFGRLMEDTDEDQLGKDEANERRIMALLLKIKSGTPPQRKTAMRQITDKARSFGAGPLFNQILPLLMSPTLEDQERHLLVKVIDRVLYKLDDLVRPYVHRILAVIEPLLIDEDYYARVEGREIISNLAKAAGLATMIATMRPDIDSPDEYVRNTTSRAFAVVASALGVPALLPFLKAVCQSRKSWQARHTGIKIVQQIALLMGPAVLPYLRSLVEIVSHGLTDDMQKVRIITALTLSALAEAAHPYGIESFDSVIRPLWKGALEHHGKALAAFLKAIGFIIPLMEENYASHSTRLVMPILIREFHSPDEEMKKIVLKVIQQCVATAGVEPEYIRTEILPEFFKNFWIRRMALDRRNYNQVVETTVELANKVGCSDIVGRIVDDLKDDSEPYRRMVMETINKVLTNLGAGDIDERLEERLIDGILYAFQEQAVDATSTGSGAFGKEGQIMLDGFGTVVNALGERCKPYLKQIAGTIKWRLNNKAASVRMQAADLIGRIAVVMKACGEDELMGHLGVVLYEYLGEEYPEVLGSILGALRAIVSVIGMDNMTPPIRDLLPRLTPILRNRHEKVQENCIDLVSSIVSFDYMSLQAGPSLMQSLSLGLSFCIRYYFGPAPPLLYYSDLTFSFFLFSPPGWSHRRSRCPFCIRQGMDAYLLRIARNAKGSQKGHSPCRRQYLWVHCSCHWSPRCVTHFVEQSQGARSSNACLYDGRHCHCRGNVWSLHRAAGTHE